MWQNCWFSRLGHFNKYCFWVDFNSLIFKSACVCCNAGWMRVTGSQSEHLKTAARQALLHGKCLKKHILQSHLVEPIEGQELVDFIVVFLSILRDGNGWEWMGWLAYVDHNRIPSLRSQKFSLFVLWTIKVSVLLGLLLFILLLFRFVLFFFIFFIFFVFSFIFALTSWLASLAWWHDFSIHKFMQNLSRSSSTSCSAASRSSLTCPGTLQILLWWPQRTGSRTFWGVPSRSSDPLLQVIYKYRGSMSQNISLVHTFTGGLTPNILSFPLAPDAGRRGMWLASSIRSLSRKKVPKCPQSYHLTMRPLPDARVAGWNILKCLDPAWLRCKV